MASTKAEIEHRHLDVMISYSRVNQNFMRKLKGKSSCSSYKTYFINLL